MKLTIMIDTPDSFLHDYKKTLISYLRKKGHEVHFIDDSKDIPEGDCLFLLGCSAILSEEQLCLNKHNLVVHPSKLPEGRGSGALVWKILEGENTIYITLFEASSKVDRGDIYFQETIDFEGHELCDEIRKKQALKVLELVMKFVDTYPNLEVIRPDGPGSYYRKRTPKDSQLNIDQTIREQFNLLRVVDNHRYPAFFIHKGFKYIVKIYKES